MRCSGYLITELCGAIWDLQVTKGNPDPQAWRGASRRAEEAVEAAKRWGLS